MKAIFYDSQHRLRNGWWMLLFLFFVLVTVFLHQAVRRLLDAWGVPDLWREPLPVLYMLLATWACTRARGESLASVGFQLDRRWARELCWGFALGIGGLLLATGLIMAIGAVRFVPDPARSVDGLSLGLYVFFFAALVEEILFRGFLFQRLLDGVGVWGAQIVLAVLFALAHWDNPGMDGVTRIWASIDIGLAAVLLGLAYLRTRSLALPLGLHLGWNWAQGSMLGFGVSGVDQHGWWQPVFGAHASWISGGEFGPEASVFGVVADLAMIALLWKWRGSVPVKREASTRPCHPPAH